MISNSDQLFLNERGYTAARRMESVKLPTEEAHEPNEEARQPLCDSTMSSQEEPGKKRKGHAITFADDVSTEPSQSGSAYKEVLSQPAPGLSHRLRLAWLQRRRGPGLWVQCDSCDSWRHLPVAVENHQLPAKWYCSMNPDKSMADCSIPETPLRITEQEDLIHSEYSAGSLVWARLPGWPWWPAMVDDCPDTEQFYWLDGFSDIPTHYNVVFFDATDVTRAWIDPENLKPYTSNKATFRRLLDSKKYKKRLEKAVQQAEKAEKLPVLDRLAQFSFISTYKGPIISPKKVTKHELERIQNKLKRKYNVEFPIEVSSDSENESVLALRASNKKKNVIIIGTPKSSKTRSSLISNDAKENAATKRSDNTKRLSNETPKDKRTKEHNANGEDESSTRKEQSIDDSNNKKPENLLNSPKKPKCATESVEALASANTEDTNGTFKHTSTNGISIDTFKRPDSLAIEIGSTQTLNLNSELNSLDNDSSKTYVPEDESNLITSQDFHVRIETPSSDDFDF